MKILHNQKELEPTNEERFVNSACRPSCSLEVWTVDGQLYAALFAGPSGLKEEEEVTFDYSGGKAQTTIRCLCRSDDCRGWI